MTTADLAIKTTDLTKQYKGSENFALNSLNLEINWGEAYGFLGPNGAGKSTTIRLLMNFLQPSSGEAYIAGQKVGSSAQLYSNVGYLSGDFVAYPKMSGSAFLNYMFALSGKSTNNSKELAERLEIDLSKPIGSLSKGNRQKIGIIQAFMSAPKVLILDEPTSGLDPLKQEVFYELVGEARQTGASIFVSSHNLAEVQKMCDRVGIIRDGRLVHQSTLADLELEASQTFEVTFVKRPSLAEIKKIPGVKSVKSEAANEAAIHMHGDLSALLGFLAKHKITKLESHELDLESEFMRYYNTQHTGEDR